MKIIIFDPLYSSVGHFLRYQTFLVGLLVKIEAVTEIELYCASTELHPLTSLSDKVKIRDLAIDTEALQINIMKAGHLKKLKLAWRSYALYHNVVKIINQTDATLVLFPSQGLVSFWLAARNLKIPYAVSLISIKWIYEKYSGKWLLYKIFSLFIKNASLNIFIEPYYKEIISAYVQSRGIVMPDRYMVEKQGQASKHPTGIIQLTTLGTISRIKSPLSFLKEFVHLPATIAKNFNYQIQGKILDNSLTGEMNELLSHSDNVEFTDDYISKASYENALRAADFAVIPYSAAYTKYSTSGVMWDCLERRVPIICPDIEPFRYYITNYKIGYLYEEGNLHSVLNKMFEEQEYFFSSLNDRFALMEKNHSQGKYVEVLQQALRSTEINDPQV
jgi:glycosyltransferase involved in cell wall biosynthesis